MSLNANVADTLKRSLCLAAVCLLGVVAVAVHDAVVAVVALAELYADISNR